MTLLLKIDLLLQLSVFFRIQALFGDQCLEVADLDHLALAFAIFDQRIDLHRILCMLCQ